jgi:hypothetical protein
MAGRQFAGFSHAAVRPCWSSHRIAGAVAPRGTTGDLQGGLDHAVGSLQCPCLPRASPAQHPPEGTVRSVLRASPTWLHTGLYIVLLIRLQELPVGGSRGNGGGQVR